MIPQKIDRFVFTPYLKELWGKCDVGDGYWTFLERIYPSICSCTGEVEEWTENIPEEYFYDFIVNENLLRHNHELDDIDWPNSADDFKEDHARIPVERIFIGKNMETTAVITTNSWRFTEFLESVSEDYEVDYCGAKWDFDIKKIRENKTKYESLIKLMEKDDFPLKKEYNQMRKYSKEFFAQFDKMKNGIDSDDWFDTLS